jgi:hypothetical protein
LARGQPDGGSKQRQRSFSHDKIPLLIPEPHVVVTTLSSIFNPLALTRLQKIKACTQLPEVLCQKCHKYEYLSTAVREEPGICAANIFSAARIAYCDRHIRLLRI